MSKQKKLKILESITDAKESKMKKIPLTADEVIEQIAEILKEADGDFIEHIANQVLGNKVKYKEDSVFVLEIP